MIALFKSRKKEKVRSLEHRLHQLVERKEQRLQAIDESGRDIVLALGELVGSFDQRMSYRNIVSEAERYWRTNKQFF